MGVFVFFFLFSLSNFWEKRIIVLSFSTTE